LNPRQRRGVLLLVLASIGAIVVFVLVSNYVSDVRKDVTPTTSVVVLTQDVPALEQIPPGALTRRTVPAKYAPRRAIHEELQIGDRVPSTSLPAGIELQDGMLIEPPALQKGQQEVSILISADTGVAGKVAPGDRVDVNATFAGDQDSLPSARKIITNAKVITVGIPQANTRAFQQQSDASNGAGAQAAPSDQVVPVTFALEPADVLRLTYAESFAQQIRLSLVRPDDANVVTGTANHEFELPRSVVRPTP
jgi:pilus assembly protein CpaB